MEIQNTQNTINTMNQPATEPQTLEQQRQQAEQQALELQNKIDELGKQIEDRDKPRISDMVADTLHDRINMKVEEALTDIDAYNCEFELELNGKEIEVYRLSIDSAAEIAEQVADSVLKMFRIVEQE